MIPSAAPTDIFSLAATSNHLFAASGASGLRVYSTANASPDDEVPYPLVQTLDGAHKLGAHHVCVSGNGATAASTGFGGEVKIWELSEGTQQWQEKGKIVGAMFPRRKQSLKQQAL